MIRNNKMEVGLALSPKTPVDPVVEELIAEGNVDKMLIMSVEPGFGGQKFIPQVLDKVRYLSKKFPDLHIQVDGGIGPDNSALIAESGANWLVAGSAIFCAKDRKLAIESIRANANQGIQNRQWLILHW